MHITFKYDGTSAFETFYAQFLNCSVYNQWTKTDQLARLKATLQKEAGQVLWDYGPEVTHSYKELVGTLKGRFGGAHQWVKFCMEFAADDVKTEKVFKVCTPTSDDWLRWPSPTYNIQQERPLPVTISLMR